MHERKLTFEESRIANERAKSLDDRIRMRLARLGDKKPTPQQVMELVNGALNEEYPERGCGELTYEMDENSPE